MKYLLTPELFNQIAFLFSASRWSLLQWSLLSFLLFLFLEKQITQTTPHSLIWLAILILFSALQALVFASFIFFFQNLPSLKARDKYWFNFYRAIEWCETIIFTLLLPFPVLLFIYAFYVTS